MTASRRFELELEIHNSKVLFGLESKFNPSPEWMVIMTLADQRSYSHPKPGQSII